MVLGRSTLLLLVIVSAAPALEGARWWYAAPLRQALDQLDDRRLQDDARDLVAGAAFRLGSPELAAEAIVAIDDPQRLAISTAELARRLVLAGAPDEARVAVEGGWARLREREGTEGLDLAVARLGAAAALCGARERERAMAAAEIGVSSSDWPVVPVGMLSRESRRLLVDGLVLAAGLNEDRDECLRLTRGMMLNRADRLAASRDQLRAAGRDRSATVIESVADELGLALPPGAREDGLRHDLATWIRADVARLGAHPMVAQQDAFQVVFERLDATADLVAAGRREPLRRELVVIEALVRELPRRGSWRSLSPYTATLALGEHVARLWLWLDQPARARATALWIHSAYNDSEVTPILRDLGRRLAAAGRELDCVDLVAAAPPGYPRAAALVGWAEGRRDAAIAAP